MKTKQVLTKILMVATLSQFALPAAQAQDVVSEAERQRATDDLISIIKNTKYFDFVDSRTHGIPLDNKDGRYGWGAMWTGVQVTKLQGVVHFTHRSNGSDNIGIHTAPYLEGACYAYKLTGDKRYEQLARKLMRGFSSWILSSARENGEIPSVLSRAVYPASFYGYDNGRLMSVNYNASRPGHFNSVAEYVHVPNNPYFGDIWIKNRRSIDDIGHMLRAIAQVQGCADFFSGEAKQDLQMLNSLYYRWARSVDANSFNIPTFDRSANITSINKGLGDYKNFDILGADPNCAGKLSVRLLHTSDAGRLHCGHGVSGFERVLSRYLHNDAVEILRTHHVAAVAWATLRNRTDLANQLKEGLVQRKERDYQAVLHPEKWSRLDIQDIPVLYVHAFNVGVPLKTHEAKFIYDRLKIAADNLASPAHRATFNLFDPSVPDGDYSYDAPNAGLYFYTIAPLIGTCSSNLRAKSQSLFDCERLRQAL